MLSHFILILTITLSVVCFASSEISSNLVEDRSATEISQEQLHVDNSINQTFDAFFKKTVSENGLVNYTKLRKTRSQLATLTRSLKNLKIEEYITWTDQEQQAFWINAHNLCIMKLVTDNYPIETFKLKLIFYPENSIMHLRSPRSKHFFNIMGRDYNLDELEAYVGEIYGDPKAYFALSYASLSSAPLRNEAYLGYKLDAQLDDQMRKFIANPLALKIDTKNRIIYLSDIFNWYEEEITETYSSASKFRAYSPDIRATFNMFYEYLPKTKQTSFPRKDFDVKYIRYDWHLNDITSTK